MFAVTSVWRNLDNFCVLCFQAAPFPPLACSIPWGKLTFLKCALNVLLKKRLLEKLKFRGAECN